MLRMESFLRKGSSSGEWPRGWSGFVQACCPVLISTEGIQAFRAETETHLNRCGYLRVTANLTFDVILEPYSNGRGARCLRSHSLSLKE